MTTVHTLDSTTPESVDVRDPIKVYDARWEVDDFDDAEVTRLFEATLAYGRLTGRRHRDAHARRPARLPASVGDRHQHGRAASAFASIACADPISTPQGYFVALRTSARHPKTMGLAITASHNPAQYIGIKFTVPTVQAIGLDCGPLGGLTKVREIYHSDETFRRGSRRRAVSRHRIPPPSTSTIRSKLPASKPGELAGLTVVLDAFHGSAGPELWHALTKAGVRVVPLRLVPNGEFPTGSPNPTSQGKMDRAIQLAAAGEGRCRPRASTATATAIVFGDRRGIFSAGFVTVPILRTLLDEGKLTAGAKVLYDPKVQSARARRVGPARRRAGAVPQRPFADQGLHDADRRPGRGRGIGPLLPRIAIPGSDNLGRKLHPHDPAVSQGRETNRPA